MVSGRTTAHVLGSGESTPFLSPKPATDSSLPAHPAVAPFSETPARLMDLFPLVPLYDSSPRDFWKFLEPCPHLRHHIL